VAGSLAAALVGGSSRDAEACGCFTPPDPSVPVVQAGERILFFADNGVITAHIQIQYSGDAAQFGWLLPLPSLPKLPLDLSTDELFTQLISKTQPKYRLVTSYQGSCGFAPQGRGGFQTAAPSVGGAAGTTNDNGSSPLVFQDSVGPFDYAVLKADSQDAMLNWLSTNHYFVPAGTDQTVSHYINPGAYFLALKLQSGRSTGDLQPVVVHYQSELPMIPIVLTSVAAQPNMGIQVWMLGQGRAIPRNYYHTVINDLAIDWSTSGQNYNDVIINQVGQAPGKHAFVTEYAGTSSLMQKVLNPDGRFGTQAELAASPDAFSFVQYLQTHGYAFTSQLVSLLSTYRPEPAALVSMGVTPTNFYQSLSGYRGAYPDAFTGWPTAAYVPDTAAQDIFTCVVMPTLNAGALFDQYPRLTRLYTTLSPEFMNEDPVFSFNPTLPDVPNEHQATLTYYCGMGSQDRTTTPARLVTEQGWTRDFPDGTGTGTVVPPPPAGLAPRRIESLSEEKATILSDNPPPSGCACDVGGSSPAAASIAGVLVLAAAATLRLRRRRARA